MKAPAVHRFLSQHFMPFLYEHGMERPMAPVKGMTACNHAGFHIRMGYALGVGFYDWTGNTIRLDGFVYQSFVTKRSLQSSFVQPDDLLPSKLRTSLRNLAVKKLVGLIQSAQSKDPSAAGFLPNAGSLALPWRQAQTDHLFVPDYRYQNEDDLREWCGVVRPFIPDCIFALKQAAEELRNDR